MPRPPHEVADVVRGYGAEFLREYGSLVTSARRRVLDAIATCRTAVLGGHLYRCTQCDADVPAYNSCRNRHCPKCGGRKQWQWARARAQDVLPVSYFHVVFTLPHELAPLALANPRIVYGLLFQAASETLLTLAADPKQLGARIGVIAVLHTWGQTLEHHPHVHCLVPGGGLALDGSRWVSCKKDFLLPVRVMRTLFRGKLLALLARAHADGRLVLRGEQAALADRHAFTRLLRPLRKRKWVVYAKRPFGGPEQVLRYLARYTHRLAISNHRLVAIEEGSVTFRWKDYRDGASKLMRLEAGEFLRRFLLHVVPQGFVRIRHYGILSNRSRKSAIARARELLAVVPEPERKGVSEAEASSQEERRCPRCERGLLVLVCALEPERGQSFGNAWLGAALSGSDTS